MICAETELIARWIGVGSSIVLYNRQCLRGGVVSTTHSAEDESSLRLLGNSSQNHLSGEDLRLSRWPPGILEP